MTKLPGWWWISMALWPITGVPVIAYAAVIFGNLTPFLTFRPEGWSLFAWAAAIFATYHPLILLPFAALHSVIRKSRSHAQD